MGLLNHPDVMRAVKPDQTPVAGACRFVFKAGSDNLCPIFRDRHLTYTIGNPMMSDSNGDFAPCYLLEGAYRVRIEDRFGKVLMDVDGVEVTEATGGGGSTITQTGASTLLPSVTALIADEVLAYNEGADRVQVSAGDSVRVEAPAYLYEVAAPDATDYHTITAGGLKLYALPDGLGQIFTSQLNWAAGTDVTDDMVRLFARWPEGARTLRQTADYMIRGSEYTLPTALRAWLSDDYELLSHGEVASRSLLLMDACDQSADSHGLTRDLKIRFFTPSGFKVGGLRFDHSVAVDETQLVAGGNASEVFNCTDNAIGLTVDKCRFDFEGGTAVQIVNSKHWAFTANHAGKQKYLLNLVGGAHFGTYSHNRGEMGFVGLKANGQPSTFFGDYIKTTPTDNVGPRYCKCEYNEFINENRDGPDGTGGFHGWTFAENYFRVAVAAIDIKIAYNLATDFATRENQYSNITIRNNIFDGCGLVYTCTWKEAVTGVANNPDLMLRHIVSQGNHFIPRPGKGSSAHFFKSYRGTFLSLGDTMSTFTGANAGAFDASTGAFPANAVKNSYYTVTVAGVVDGQSFAVNDTVYALKTGASTTTYAGNWYNTGKTYPRIAAPTPFKCGIDGVGTHTVNKGTWNAASGSFPSGAVLGDFYTSTSDGTVGGVKFRTGDIIVATTATPSTSTYEGQWEVRTPDSGLNENMVFRSLVFDGRGASALQIMSCRNVSVDFADYQSDGLGTISVSGEDITITGNMRSEALPPLDSGVCDIIVLNGCRNVRIDTTYSHKRGASHGGALVRVTGKASRVWIDGTVTGSAELVEVANAGVLTDLYLGQRSSLTVEALSARVLTITGTANGVWQGRLDNPDGVPLFNNPPAVHNLGHLAKGQGRELTIASGTVKAQRTAHRVDTEGDAASDDLVTVSGGALGDQLMICCADASRAVVAKTGTGNLRLVSDRTLDNPGDTLVLEMRGDGNWHEVSFTDQV
ncbi:hypothetical protein [uncultured Maritimibacter sp.]|uniref:hypothetical protein n=1 Tax=uncultured Maritimibacter sp. TaxID=991866 RepID=UPI0025993D47|nr:hypothetical protein [uncultured Maritimibacter sp.]